MIRGRVGACGHACAHHVCTGAKRSHSPTSPSGSRSLQAPIHEDQGLNVSQPTFAEASEKASLVYIVVVCYRYRFAWPHKGRGCVLYIRVLWELCT